jgi:hypothetical protein
LRCFVVPTVLAGAWLLVASVRPVLAQTADTAIPVERPASPGALVHLGAGITVQVNADALVINDGEDTLFRARLKSWSPVTELALATPGVHARLIAWDYPHLRDIAFADLALELDDGSQPALQLEFADEFERVIQRLHPHDGMGGRGQISVSAWQRVLQTEDTRSYLAIVRLDGARPKSRGDDLYSFEAPDLGESIHWPLAIIRADTAAELRARMGQAVIAFNGAGARENPDQWWRVPALCGVCQQQQVSEVELDLQDRDSSLLLRVRTVVQYEGHAAATAEGMRIEGLALGPWLTGEQGDEAWFVIPLGEPLADALIAVAMSGDARVEARLSTGETREVATVRVLLDPAFQERLYSREPETDETDWPTHLSARLVSSWPNPFRDSTTIEITVPRTIGEAFELGPDLLLRVQPEAAPPFGTNPMVRVKVYNVSGQLVNVLEQGVRGAGRFTVGWSGQDLQGRPVASGAYFVHVEMEEWSVTRRVLLLRN